MEFKYVKDEKNSAEIQLDNLTVAELLRSYLAKDEGVSFVAWKREHPSKSPMLKIETKGKTVKKALSDAASKIDKDVNKLVNEFKKAK